MTSCKDWEYKLKNGISIIPSPKYPEFAEYALQIFKSLQIPDLPGMPTFGEASAPWVFDFVRAIFGFFNVETQKQEIKEYFLEIAKKNTKSTLASAIMLTSFIINFRHNDEQLIVAPTIEVARNSFNPLMGMIRANEQLSKRFVIKEHIRVIEDRLNNNRLKVVAFDSRALAGVKASILLVDELWVLGQIHHADATLMEAQGGLVSRPEGFIIYLTTQSDTIPSGVFKEKLKYARDVRDGKIKDEAFLPILFEYSEKQIENEEYLLRENWKQANPNLGKSVSIDWLEREMKKNETRSKESLQKFLAKHFNIEIGVALSSERWAGADHWIQAEKNHSLDELIERSEVITIGIDGGGYDDLLGLYILGRTKDNEILGYGYAWAHEKVKGIRKEIASRLEDFEKLKEFSFISSNKEEENKTKEMEDIKQLADLCLRIKDSGKLQKIGIDPAGTYSILQALKKRGFYEDEVVGISQGWKLGGTIKTVERWLLTTNAFSPKKQELMRWCVGNARIENRSNAIIITKQQSGSSKIDPLIALFNAAQIMASIEVEDTYTVDFF